LNQPQQDAPLQATYFDGQVLKGTPVQVHRDSGQLLFFLGDTKYAVDLSNIKRLESFGNAPIVLELPGSATLEFDRQSSLNTLKAWNVLSLSWFEKIQYHPTRWLLVSMVSIAFAAGLYTQGLPLLSKWITQHYSREFEREADLFAIDLFVKQGRDLAALELLSHPGADERLRLIRKNQ
jgi:hypothetical protein